MNYRTEPTCRDGFHVKGLRDHLGTPHFKDRLRREERKLRRRLENYCAPMNPWGRLKVWWTGRRLMKRIRARWVPPHALFLAGRGLGFGALPG